MTQVVETGFITGKYKRPIAAMFDDAETMTSRELMGVINVYREQDGKQGYEHHKFMRLIEDELENEAALFAGTYESVTGQGAVREYKQYRLPYDECMQVAMRESKTVRRAVIVDLKIAQAAIEAREAIINESHTIEQAQQKLAVERTKEHQQLLDSLDGGCQYSRHSVGNAKRMDSRPEFFR